MKVETRRKFKACFSGNSFSLVTHHVFSDPTNKYTSCLHRSQKWRSMIWSQPVNKQGSEFLMQGIVTQTKNPSGLYSSQSMPIAPFPYPKLIFWHQGLIFASFWYYVHPKVNMGCMSRICLLNAHTPSFLINNYKFPCPFHQYICNLTPYDYKKIVSPISGKQKRGNLLSYLLVWLLLK